MKSNWMRLGSAALAILLFAGFAVAGGFGGRHDDFLGGRMLKFFADYLDLTDAQQSQIRQIYQNAEPAMKPLREQEWQSRQAMKQLITGNFDLAKAQAIAAQESQVRAQIEVQHAQLASQAYQVLTEEQKNKLAQFMAKREQRFKERMQQGSPQAPPASN